MSALIPNPFTQFPDLAGRPLDNGEIYIGQPNLDPKDHPIDVYWDQELTLPAVQPIPTLGGLMFNDNAPGMIYADVDDFSVRVLDKNGRQIYFVPSMKSANLFNVGKGLPDSAVSVQAAYTGALVRNQHDRNGQYLELKDFCKMDGSDETAGFLAWIAALKLSGKAGWFNEGNCIVSGNIAIDLADQNGNLTIIGAGLSRSKLVIVNTVTEPAFKIYDSNGHINADLFYVTFRDWGIATHVAGAGVMLGSHDFSDALNACVFDQFACWNSNDSPNSTACEINYVVQSQLNITCNNAGSGVGGSAIRIRQLQFSTLQGSGGNSNYSLHFTDGYVYANTIHSFDSEEVNKCVMIDGTNVGRNTFIGGQLVWKSGGCGIDAIAGAYNIFINPNFGLPDNKVFGTIGVTVIGNSEACGQMLMPGLQLRSILNEDIVMQLTPSANRQAVQQFNSVNAVRRWQIRQDSAVESGGNTGSDLVITAYNDSGDAIGDALYVTRNNRVVSIPRASLTGVGFFGASIATSAPVITGSSGGNVALANLLQQLAALGLITNSTS